MTIMSIALDHYTILVKELHGSKATNEQVKHNHKHEVIFKHNCVRI